ncbi:substrate-binding domain-containing protein [Ruminococcus sp. OA3]|uniref:substrate-binding domain-containing protein n=1 Tax=Ruminococcus sp. OA3 TaxID=2914164 RepID=UPI001F055B01|nr:substrate-binding domain-containing protein [Ruminococcus sp. OA3]MCH1982137.1 substrate-binding domain-containing protein [Ruminococcus sp. OA3]
MKRRLIACLLTGVLALGMLSGCGGGEEKNAAPAENSDAGGEGDAAPAKDSDAGDESAEGSGDLGTVTLILSNRDEFLSTLETGVQNAAKDMGVNMVTQDAQNDTSKLLQFVETAKNDGQKAIIVNPVDPATCSQIVEAAGDMKVVLINRYPTEESVLSESVVYAGSDEMESGKYQGEYLAEHFKAAGKTEIKYILLNGMIGQTSTTQRTESCLQALEDAGITATEATAPLAADWDRATAQDMITPLLTTIDYDCIISNNDAMALGAIEAMKSVGLDPASIPIVGVDATVDGCQAIKEGTLAMTVFQDAEGQGVAAMKSAQNLVDGKPLNEGTDFTLDETGNVLWVPFVPVTADNVDEYM